MFVIPLDPRSGGFLDYVSVANVSLGDDSGAEMCVGRQSEDQRDEVFDVAAGLARLPSWHGVNCPSVTPMWSRGFARVCCNSGS